MLASSSALALPSAFDQHRRCTDVAAALHRTHSGGAFFNHGTNSLAAPTHAPVLLESAIHGVFNTHPNSLWHELSTGMWPKLLTRIGESIMCAIQFLISPLHSHIPS
jgi:hypothetical protein